MFSNKKKSGKGLHLCSNEVIGNAGFFYFSFLENRAMTLEDIKI